MDEQMKGKGLTRRRVLQALGVGGLMIWAGQIRGEDTAKEGALVENAIPDCVMTPQQTQGPYFTDIELNRPDIRTDPVSGVMPAGIPLELQLRVLGINAEQCAPLKNARVDIWHCDVNGIYSDVRDHSFNTVGQKFLRGYQTTDADGRVKFTTIYPGWYPGRTVHIHFKVRAKAPDGRMLEFVSQLYFDDGFTDRVYTREPYAKRPERFPRNNQGDGIFQRGGANLLLKLSETARSYPGTFDVGMYLG